MNIKSRGFEGWFHHDEVVPVTMETVTRHDLLIVGRVGNEYRFFCHLDEIPQLFKTDVVNEAALVCAKDCLPKVGTSDPPPNLIVDFPRLGADRLGQTWVSFKLQGPQIESSEGKKIDACFGAITRQLRKLFVGHTVYYSPENVHLTYEYKNSRYSTGALQAYQSGLPWRDSPFGNFAAPADVNLRLPYA